MKVNYLLDTFKESSWILIQEGENQEVVSQKEFDILPDVVKHVKELKGEVRIHHLDICGFVDLKDGEVVRVTSDWGLDDDYLNQHWKNNGVPLRNENYEEYSCTSCRDGGCPSCRPSWFL